VRASDTVARKARYRASNRPIGRSGMSFTCYILASLRNIGEDLDHAVERDDGAHFQFAGHATF
jgi:hypothetical protein